MSGTDRNPSHQDADYGAAVANLAVDRNTVERASDLAGVRPADEQRLESLATAVETVREDAPEAYADALRAQPAIAETLERTGTTDQALRETAVRISTPSSVARSIPVPSNHDCRPRRALYRRCSRLARTPTLARSASSTNTFSRQSPRT